MQTRSSTTVLLHSIFWLLIIQLLFDWTGLYSSFQILFDSDEHLFDDAFLIIPLTISLFYWNSNFLIPRLLNRQTWGNYLIGIVLSFFLHLLIGGLMYFFVESQGLQVQFDLGDFLDNLLMFQLIGVAMSSAWRVSNIAFENSARRKEAEQKQKEAELKYLNAQFNPHFLFNTLNSIYSLSAEEDAPRTTETILKFSEIMRYPLKEGAQKEVKLTSEIQFLNDFIDLQKLRLGDDYPIQFVIEGAVESIQIAPMLFISFIENAFKYGVSQQYKSPIFIKIACQQNTIHFEVQNEIVKKENLSSHSLGIQNVGERLNLLYPNNYQLEIKEAEKKFQVCLSISM